MTAKHVSDAKLSDHSMPAHVALGVNRRGILMNSVVCLASVAASTAIARPVDVPQDDPIFAAIARQIETGKAEAQACKEADEAEEAFKEEFGAMHPDAFSRKCREGLAAIEPKFRECRTDTHEKIDAGKGRFPDDVIAGLHSELDRQKIAYAECVQPKRQAMEEAARAAEDAVYAMVRTRPTTFAGIVALLKHLQENDELATRVGSYEFWQPDERPANPYGTYFGALLESLSDSVEQLMAA
jgi:hypothetical protein